MNDANALADGRRLALEHPFDGPSLGIVGPPGSGKSTLLAERALAASAAGSAVLLTAASGRGAARLRTLLDARGGERVRCAPLDAVAFDVVAAQRASAGASAPHAIDEVAASHLFEGVGAGLFALEWTDLLSDEIDPEVTGLRAPERFSAAAYRLFRKLRAAAISPDAFFSACMRGATKFYANPPNFADASLIEATPEKYRDSLRVGTGELERQRRREVDLAKVLHRLYQSYLDTLVAHGCLTGIDALCEATAILRADEAGAAVLRRRTGLVLIDDAQDLVEAQAAFLRALAGDALRGVTLAGDRDQATRGFAIGGNARYLAATETTVALGAPASGDPAIAAVARRALPGAAVVPAKRPAAVVLYRASSPRDEAQFVASEVAKALASGIAAADVAVIARNLRCANPYLDALLARGVPVDIAGDAGLYDFPAVQDALAALWTLADPFRHDALLRVLESPWLALSDASIATLCGDAPDAQTLLFELPEDDRDDTRARWDRKRDLRLGHNVLTGATDAALSEEARVRLGAFRVARERWEALERELDLPALAHTILAETVVATADADARGRFARGLVARLEREIAAFARREPLASLEAFLAYAEAVAVADADLVTLDEVDAGCVLVLDVEAAKGRRFAHAFVVGAHAGSFPRYYAPDAFLFAPRYGMIPKENVGEGARAARTAKFTYALHEARFRQLYVDEERRAFYCAATRASERLTVSAWGRPTQAKQAPELLAELMDGLRE